jgi:flagellar capping protein FliD
LTSFADTTSLTGGTIDIYTRFNGLIDVTVNGNKTLITDLNARIAEAERQIAKQAEDMKARFARLESLMGRLQQQQQSLTSALAGLR